MRPRFTIALLLFALSLAWVRVSGMRRQYHDLFLSELTQSRSIAIKLERVSPNLINAVLATEDEKFFQSHFRPSVVTMLLGRNLYRGPGCRALSEVRLGFQLEWSLSKDEILELYLNKICFGSDCYGVEEAAKLYFKKSASDLNLAEAALLAGVTQSPSTYSPLENPKTAKRRTRVILDSMHERNRLDDEQYATALTEMEQFKF